MTSPRFVGRRAELDALRAAVDRAGDGAGSVVLVGGEPGIGKTRLIAKLAAQARRDGVTVLVGECLPLGGGELPYAPIVGVLRSLARDRGLDGLIALAGAGHDELARLLPDLGAPETAGSHARLFEQLLNVFTGVARSAPLLLVVEDLHWSDRSTRDFLSFLVRAAREEPIALAVTYRSDEVDQAHAALGFVHELERSGQAVRVTLTAFNRTEIREQISAIREQTPDPRLVDRLFERAEGNPFFTEELLATAELPGDVLSESLRQVLLLRLADCPRDVAAVIRTIAVAGREIEHPMLEAVLELPQDRLETALRDAMDRHVLVNVPGSAKYAFRHALLCEAAYSDLLPSERRGVHRTLAEVLERRPELGGTRALTAAKLAHHWYDAGELGRALHASLLAGIEAEGIYAYGEALLHYERALEVWDAVAPSSDEVELDRLELLQRASEAASLAGESDCAIELAREVLERTDPTDLVATALAHERLGRRLWSASCGVDALPHHRRAVELMPDEPTAERAQILAAEARVLMLSHRVAEAEPRCDEALVLARQLGARHVEANVLNTMCANFSHAGHPELGIAAAEQAREIARELGLTEEIARSYVNGSDATDHAGRLDQAIALANEGVDVCHQLGSDRLYGDCLRGEIAGRLIRQGDWDRAAVLLEELFDTPLSGINAGNAYGHQAVLHALRGEPEQARHALNRGCEYVEDAGGSMWLAPMAEAEATTELWEGRPLEAAAAIDACIAAVADGESILATVRVYELGVRAAADIALAGLGDELTCARARDRAAFLQARMDELMARMSGPAPIRVRASRQAAAAEASRVDGADPEAWETAALLWAEYGDRYQVAYARWRQAEALLTAGRERRAAQASARVAHEIAATLGARPLTEAIEALARRGRLAVGEADGDAGDSVTAELDRLELTPREREVLALVGEGKTNREIAAQLFIADKTASVHVSRILAKLSVSNRAGAAAAAQRLGIERIGAAAG